MVSLDKSVQKLQGIFGVLVDWFTMVFESKKAKHLGSVFTTCKQRLPRNLRTRRKLVRDRATFIQEMTNFLRLYSEMESNFHNILSIKGYLSFVQRRC